VASIARASLAEAIGTFIFFTIGAGAVIVETSPTTQGSVGLIGVAAAHGLTLAIMVTVFGGISGGHFNPAVSLGVLAGGKIEAPRAFSYIGAQLVGALAAGGMLRLMFVRERWEPSNLGTPSIGIGVSVGQAILIEAVLTFVLLIAVWGTGVDPRGAKVGGFGIGLAVFVDILVGGPLTGAAMNPARHFGTAAMSGYWSDWWVYWVGPILGGLLASLVYRGAFLDEGDLTPAVAAGATLPPESDSP
jgi:aquaporin Z